jgi:hypothetical protein
VRPNQQRARKTLHEDNSRTYREVSWQFLPQSRSPHPTADYTIRFMTLAFGIFCQTIPAEVPAIYVDNML